MKDPEGGAGIPRPQPRPGCAGTHRGFSGTEGSYLVVLQAPNGGEGISSTCAWSGLFVAVVLLCLGKPLVLVSLALWFFSGSGTGSVGAVFPCRPKSQKSRGKEEVCGLSGSSGVLLGVNLFANPVLLCL